ncbi:MAG: TolC family protein [bacterium]
MMKNFILIVLIILSLNSMALAETVHLNLDKAIEMALSKGSDIILKELTLTQSKAEYLYGFGSFLMPKIDTFLSYRRSWGSAYNLNGYNNYGLYTYVPVYSDGQISSGGGVNNLYSFTAGISQPFFTPSGLFSYFSARANLSAEKLIFDDALAGIIIDTANAYFSVLKAEHILMAAEESVETAKKNLEYASRLYEMEGVSLVDVLKAQVELSNSEISLIDAQGTLERAKVDLCNRLSIPIETDLRLEEVSIEIGEYSYDECVKKERETRRQEKIYISQDRAILYSSLASYSKKLPSIYGNFSYNWSNDKLTKINWGKNDSYYIGLTLSIDLFDGFTTESAIMKARAEKRLSRISASRAEDLALTALKNAFLSYEEAKKKVDLTQTMLSTAKLELELAQRRYELGAGSIIELTDAQSQYLSSVSQSEDAKYSLLISEMQLKRAMGVPLR